jgi:hypothetical protein
LRGRGLLPLLSLLLMPLLLLLPMRLLLLFTSGA